MDGWMDGWIVVSYLLRHACIYKRILLSLELES